MDYAISNISALKIFLDAMPEAGVEPARALGPGDFESPASANSATPALS